VPYLSELGISACYASLLLMTCSQAPLDRDVWGDTAIPLPEEAPRTWLNVLTGEVLKAGRSPQAPVLRLRDVLRSFPIALLSATAS
jgi:(1->4)-alpha-D-glucan 1-alpha-D-glucosylmutase